MVEESAAGSVVTVRGPVDPSQLGVTLPHEHLLVDLYDFTMDESAWIFDEGLVEEELRHFLRKGGQSIVDATSIGIGRNPSALRRLATALDINIVMGTGWYREAVYPPEIDSESVEDLAAILIHDLLDGVGESGIRAGIIGEIGTERGRITRRQEKVFNAASLAHHATGALILAHCTRGELAREQLALLTSAGVSPTRIAFAHQGDRWDVSQELDLLAAGAFVVFDHIGYEEFQTDAQRVKNLVRLIDAGFLPQLLISTDICFLGHLHWFGGKGFDYLLREFAPLLWAAGIDQTTWMRLVARNPANALTWSLDGAD